MTKNLDKEGLSSIADKYELFYVDLWGVIHNGIILHEKAISALKEITKRNKDYVLLTNAPRPNKTVKYFLEKMDLFPENFSQTQVCFIQIYIHPYLFMGDFFIYSQICSIYGFLAIILRLNLDRLSFLSFTWSVASLLL